MVLPQDNKQYSTRAYWDLRYAEEGSDGAFDWFKSYADLAGDIRALILDKSARVLMLGCGNSKLSQDMWDDGYKHLVNVDYSPVVIDAMRTLHADARPEMEWHVMDVRALAFPDASFDVVIDKGTMDAIMASTTDVWNPPEQVVNDCIAEVSDALRVLRPGGVFVYITFGQPHFRRQFFTGPHTARTSFEIRMLGDAFHYFMYILRKEA